MMTVNYKDFFKMTNCTKEVPNMNGLFGKNRDGITEKQKTLLHSLGIGTTGLKYKGQASIVIDYALYRRQHGMATPGQMRTLLKNGVKNVHEYTFAAASTKISSFPAYRI